MAQEGRGDFSPQAAVEKGLISCGRDHLQVFLELWQEIGVPLELQRGPQGSDCVASGKSSLHVSCEAPLRIPLQSFLGPRSSSGSEARTSGFLSSVDMEHGVPMEFQHGSQSSSLVETCNSAFFLSGNSSVRLHVELT